MGYNCMFFPPPSKFASFSFCDLWTILSPTYFYTVFFFFIHLVHVWSLTWFYQARTVLFSYRKWETLALSPYPKVVVKIEPKILFLRPIYLTVGSTIFRYFYTAFKVMKYTFFFFWLGNGETNVTIDRYDMVDFQKTRYQNWPSMHEGTNEPSSDKVTPPLIMYPFPFETRVLIYDSRPF